MRAKIRRPKQRGGARWYYGALALIVIAGVVGIGLSAGSDDVHPFAGVDPDTGTFYDHWHQAIGVNVCGEWVSDAPTFEYVAGTTVLAGIHTHADGFIHIHPRTSADAGDNATLEQYFDNGGWAVDETSFDIWQGPAVNPTKTAWENGDKCPAGSTMAGRKGVVRWEVDCKTRKGNPAEYKLQDLHVLTLAFLPKNEDIETPPHAFEAPSADVEGETPVAPDVKSCETSGPGGETPTTTTTVAGATTTTTAPGSTTTSSTP